MFKGQGRAELTATKTILLVEDGRAEKQLITGLLSQMGLEVVAFEGVEPAWAWLLEHTPALVLLDIVMAGQSGLDLCRMIRARPEFSQLPIVFCTSKNQEFDRFWAMRQGGNAYITKPFAPKELVAVVQQFVQ
jgi:twitching motility two-component system response regulator PilH